MTDEGPLKAPRFQPDVYDVDSLAAAKKVTVTGERGTTSDERWAKETPFLIEDIGRALALGPEHCLLDYGCGTGRVAKGLIERYGCRVLGVDTSESMRRLAPPYVDSERFEVCSPAELDERVAQGFRADVAVCLWVLQHAFDPLDLIDRIARTLRSGGRFYSLNSLVRCLPTDQGYINDGYYMRGGLCDVFVEEAIYNLPLAVTTPGLSANSMIQLLRKPG